MFGFARGITSLIEMRTTKLLDYMILIINYLRKRKVGGFREGLNNFLGQIKNRDYLIVGAPLS